MSSGTSTPRTMSTTPTPPVPTGGGGGGGGTSDPSPLTVGTQFVKKYYNVLSTSPGDIDRFYKNSTSIVTRGEGSDPAIIISTDFTDGAAASRFLRADQKDDPIRFEFEHGAIDAQQSVNSGIVLVATGSVVYVRSEIRKSFVHTFFLGSTALASSSSKRSYYVHNDILRFLDMESNVEKNGARKSLVDSTIVEDGVVIVQKDNDPSAPKDTKEIIEQTIPVEEPKDSTLLPSATKDIIPADAPLSEAPPAVTTETAVAEETDAPGHGVEESKEAFFDDETTVSATAKAAPATPGSWASLVARTSTTATSPPATPMRSEKVSSIVHGTAMIPQQSALPVVAKGSEVQNSVTSVTTTIPTPVVHTESIANNTRPLSQQPFRQKREAECTLIIKNIDESVTEAEIRSMFEPFTADTTATYVGCTVQGHRGIAFVDYDSPDPVIKAVQQQTDVGAFMIRDLKLDIYQKIFVDKNQHRGGGGGRGSFRGGVGNSSGGRFQGGTSGGRDFHQVHRGGGDSSGRTTGRQYRRGGGRDGRTGGRPAQATASSGDN